MQLEVPRYQHAPKPRTLRELWREVRRQFFGSDMESGYAYIYTWLANQFGHFMIGFAGTIGLAWLVATVLWLFGAADDVDLWGWSGLGVPLAFLWLAVWIAKEWLIDLAGALRNLDFAARQRDALLEEPPRTLARPSRSRLDRADLKRVGAALREYFSRGGRPPGTSADPEVWFRYDIIRDTVFDIWFYAAGAFTALAMYSLPEYPAFPLLVFAAFFAGSARVARNPLWANIAFDRADLPYVSRFALNTRPAEADARATALAFAIAGNGGDADAPPGHLVVIGPPKSGRTTVAVGLGVEALLQTMPPRDVVVYTTLCKLLDRVAEEKQALAEPDPRDPRPAWPPEDARLLIVDDVGAQGAQQALLSPQAFESELGRNAPLRAMCAGKRVVWVVGDEPRNAKRWVEALKAVFGGVGTNVQFEAVALRAPVAQPERSRAGLRAA